MLVSKLTLLALLMPRYAPHLAPPPLIDKGVAYGSVVIPEKATKAEKFAAEEIQTYLNKISGAHLTIDTSVSDGQPAILIGSRQENASARASLRRKSDKNDAFALVPSGNHLALVGNSETAIVYSAWDFLERQGVRWIMPTEKGIYIPNKKTIQLPNRAQYEIPSFDFRGPSYQLQVSTGQPASVNAPEHGIPGSLIFTYRWRENLNNNFDTADAWRNIGGGHTYGQYLPPARYFKDHPEWYSMLNGKRTAAAGQWQVCFTNQDAAKEFASNMLKEAAIVIGRGSKEERLRFWVSPNDWRTDCDDVECAKLKDSDGSVTSLVTLFANRVGAEIAKVYPKSKVCFYVYQNYTRPPEKVKPAANVAPELTYWTSANSFKTNFAKPMFSDGNERFRDWFTQWANMSPAGVSAHGYYGHWNIFTPFPQVTQLALDTPAFAQSSAVYGLTSEDHTHWGTQLPNLYLGAKMRWNAKLDVSRTLDDFYSAGFGAAAQPIQSYFETLQAQMDATAYVGGNTSEVVSILTPQVVSKCDALIAEAEQILPQLDEGAKWRTQVVIEGWKISSETARALLLYLVPTDPQRDIARLVPMLDTIQQRLKSDLGLYAIEHTVAENALNASLKAVTTDLTELPEGETPFVDALKYGGALKFRAKITGSRSNTLGYTLAPGATGVIELPFKASGNRKITKFVLRPSFSALTASQIDVKIDWIDEKGASTAMAKSITEAQGFLTLSSGLPTRSGTLKITMKNLTDKLYTALAGYSVVVTVK